jgi:hypothetical protein
MDDVPICPPWWPGLIWWLIHHPPPPPPNGNGPPIDRERLFEATQNVLVGLQLFHTANILEPNQRGALQEAATKRMTAGVEQLGRLG